MILVRIDVSEIRKSQERTEILYKNVETLVIGNMNYILEKELEQSLKETVNVSGRLK